MKSATETFEDGEAFIGRFVTNYCRPHADVERARLAAFVAARQMAFMTRREAGFSLAAGAATPVPDDVRAPDEEVTFSFASAGAPDAPGAWRASLTVPPQAGPETMLTLAVEDSLAQGAPAVGVFTLSGVALPLVDGRAQIPFGLFLAGIKDTRVSYRAPGRAAVPGTLAFFA